MIPAIVTTVPIKGVQTEIVLVAGKMGKAYAYRADDGKQLWTRSVGKHLNDTGPLPREAVDDLSRRPRRRRDADGARAARLFVPWLDLSRRRERPPACRRPQRFTAAAAA